MNKATIFICLLLITGCSDIKNLKGRMGRIEEKLSKGEEKLSLSNQLLFKVEKKMGKVEDAISQNIIGDVTDRYTDGDDIKTIRYYQRVNNKIETVRFEKYYRYGKLKYEKHYNKDGYQDAKSTYYYENGQIEKEGNHQKRGWDKDGKWIYYNEDGSIYKVEEYKDGVKVD